MSDPGPVEPDILINKLRPGHEMDIRMFAVKVEETRRQNEAVFLIFNLTY